MSPTMGLTIQPSCPHMLIQLITIRALVCFTVFKLKNNKNNKMFLNNI